MAKKKEISIEKKLRSLFDLQLIDSRIDEIRSVRGELPLEVEDLENEIAGLTSRLENFKAEFQDFQEQIASQKNNIEVAKEADKKYEANLKNVRNNREYNSIQKEQEYQKLEIELAEKKIKEFHAKSDQKSISIDEVQEKLDERTAHLNAKNEELNSIMSETEKEEKLLLKKSKEYSENIEENLIAAYNKIRSSVRNGLAIVPVERGASGGSYFAIPPQTQMEIASRNKIITDEHSGRILVDEKLAEEERDKMSSIFKKSK
jgi:predicted  nucleic acid-binding Zn-ribbon protein